MMTTTDPRVTAYLQRLEEAAAGLRPEHRAELMAEIRDHIATRLADADQTPPGVDPVVAALARLGEPEEIVAAAADEAGTPVPDGQGPRPGAPGRSGGRDVAALLLLLIGGFLFGIGWIVGVVLLWTSPTWTFREKLWATLVWPGGLATPVVVGGALTVVVARVESCVSTQSAGALAVEQCTGAGGPDWLAIGLLVAAVIAPIVVVAVLARRASRRAAPGSRSA